MATKVTIDGKTYCVETLLSEVKRLTKELALQAEADKQSKIGMLTEIQLDIQEVNTAPQFLTDDSVKDFRECVDTIIQQKINALKEE